MVTARFRRLLRHVADALMEEIYRSRRSAETRRFKLPASGVRLPTDARIAREKNNKWYQLWKTLKQGYDYFEKISRRVVVSERRYLVDPDREKPASSRPLPSAPASASAHWRDPSAPMDVPRELPNCLKRGARWLVHVRRHASFATKTSPRLRERISGFEITGSQT